jgi:hypothetical protein
MDDRKPLAPSQATASTVKAILADVFKEGITCAFTMSALG